MKLNFLDSSFGRLFYFMNLLNLSHDKWGEMKQPREWGQITCFVEMRLEVQLFLLTSPQYKIWKTVRSCWLSGLVLLAKLAKYYCWRLGGGGGGGGGCDGGATFRQMFCSSNRTSQGLDPRWGTTPVVRIKF